MQGRPIQQLVEEVYGADLPAELHEFHRRWPREEELPVDRFFHPWALLSVGSSAAASLELSEHYAAVEAAEVVSHPDFLPLMSLQASEAVHDGYVIGYSLEHLRRGSTTIFGHPGDASAQSLEELGPSLIAVLLEWMTDYHRMEKWQYEAPENRRTASDWSLRNAEQWLKELEKLRAKTVERQTGNQT